MMKDKILVLGACGQIGVELTLALRQRYGNAQVIAADIKEEHALLMGTGPFMKLDVMAEKDLYEVVRKESVTEIYLLAALLSASGEKIPRKAWDINMTSLLSILDIGVQEKLNKIFWPSSIAVFGNTTPKKLTAQKTIVESETVYGISKYAGEMWCQYYHKRWGLDVRSVRYPGLISYKGEPGGGTTDYAVDIFHEAVQHQSYTCFLKEDTYLPMMYMEDAIRGTLELMMAPAEKLSTRMAYNISGMSFCPAELAEAIQKIQPDFTIQYAPDFRQAIADGWPQSIDDSLAREDWGWQSHWNIDRMSADMLKHLSEKHKG